MSDIDDGGLTLYELKRENGAKVEIVKEGRIIANVYSPKRDRRLARGRRIVACVNACRGYKTEELEEGLAENLTLKGTMDKVVLSFEVARNAEVKALRERDEARAMVKELAVFLRNHGIHSHDCNALRQDWNGGVKGDCSCGLRATIAKAEALYG